MPTVSEVLLSNDLLCFPITFLYCLGGLVVGVLFNIYLWKAQPQIFWFWWNGIGLLLTFSIGYFGSKVMAPSDSEVVNTLDLEKPNFRMPETWVLLSYFVLIVLISCALPFLLGR